MEYYGLVKKYPVNRPLTEWEIERHLPQDKYSGCAPWPQVSVVKMNSTYLECVDKFFEGRGILAAVGLFFVCLFSLAVITVFPDFSKWSSMTPYDKKGSLLVMLFCYLLFIPIIAIFWHFMLRKELFTFTHYPMRFNRKNRMVYVTRLDGTVMIEPWDKLYFTVGNCGEDVRDIQGHRLADDGVTVLETFSLAFYEPEGSPHLLSQWEFVRQYMEYGPAMLMDMVPLVILVDERREPFMDGLARLYATTNTRGGSFLATLLMPITFVYAIGRWIGTFTSKIPHWPDEVEEACRIHPDDPYLRDHDHVAENEAHEIARDAYLAAIARQAGAVRTEIDH